jgi:hypothetical protein
VCGEGVHGQSVGAGVGDGQGAALGGGDRGAVVVDCGGRHLLRVERDVGGVDQLVGGEPSDADPAPVRPL